MKLQKLVAGVLVGALFMTGFSMADLRLESVKAEEISVPWSGEGTEASPYLITNAQDLKALADTFSSYKDKCFKMTDDIDLSSVCGESLGDWYPIGFCDDRFHGEYAGFSGIFDGNNKTIKNLYIHSEGGDLFSSNSTIGLFGLVSKGTVKNLTVTGNIYASYIREIYTDSFPYYDMGGIVGQLEYGTIQNCTNYCTISGERHKQVRLALSAGGIVGDANCSDIINCRNLAEISAVETIETNVICPGTYNIGGIVGKFTGDYESISRLAECLNKGKIITRAQGDCSGGIVGKLDKGVVEQCWNKGELSGGSNLGGIIGWGEGSYSDDHTKIRDCYNTGNILAEYTDDDLLETIIRSSRAGGIAGGLSNSVSQISNCYNIGKISQSDNPNAWWGKPAVGTLLGEVNPNNDNNNKTEITNLYSLTDKTYKGVGSTYGTDSLVRDVTDLTVELDKKGFSDQSSFSGWDFGNTWKMEKHNSPDFTRPVLQIFFGDSDEQTDDPSINPNKTISVGEKVTFKAKKKVKNVEGYDPDIVSVKTKGKKVIVTGLSAGTTTVTAYNKKGKKLGSWTVKVE